MDHRPLISIGLPVFNGEKYLVQALDSLLTQSWTDFELIISDNGSTDATQDICLEYASQDTRIIYHRNETNRGSVWNFNNVFRLSKGVYFMWAAHDDWWDKDFISMCLAKLESNPNAVLCYPLFERVPADGGPSEIVDPNVQSTSSGRLKRTRSVMQRHRTVRALYGLARSDGLRRTSLAQAHLGWDRLLLIQLVVLGEFVNVPEVLVHYRSHRRTQDEYADILGLGAPDARGRLLVRTIWTINLLRAINDLDLPRWQKPVIMLNALWGARRRYKSRYLIEWRRYLSHKFRKLILRRW